MKQQPQRTYTLDELARIKQIVEGQKDQLHGFNYGSTTQFGAFSAPGVREQMYSALVRPQSILSLCEIRPSVFEQEIVEVMTGQTAGSGSNAATYCDDPPEAGQLATAQILKRFGSYFTETTVQRLPQVGALRNRADVPREILNAGPSGAPFMPDLLFRLQDTRDQVSVALYRLGVEFERTLVKVVQSGNNATAHTSTQRGWTAEFDGLDQWVKTGYTDVNGASAEALNSSVTSYNNTLSGTIVTSVTDMVFTCTTNAVNVGMDGTQFAFVMRPELHRALVDVWADQYSVVRTTGAQYEEANRNSVEIAQLADAMLRGRYLTVLGVDYPVVYSHGMEFTKVSGTNVYRSDILFLPVSYAGKRLLVLEYFDMSNPYFQSMANLTGNIQIINNGMFALGAVGDADSAFCSKLQLAARPRLLLETPFMAGRIDDISFTYSATPANPIPGESLHPASFGVTYRS